MPAGRADIERETRSIVARARQRQARRASATGAQARAVRGTEGGTVNSHHERARLARGARARELDTDKEPKGHEERRPTVDTKDLLKPGMRRGGRTGVAQPRPWAASSDKRKRDWGAEREQEEKERDIVGTQRGTRAHCQLRGTRTRKLLMKESLCKA